jgi:hypothetical protein
MARIADPEAAKLGGNGLAASEIPGPLFLQGTGIHDSTRKFRAGDDFIQGGYCQRPGSKANPQGPGLSSSKNDSWTACRYCE